MRTVALEDLPSAPAARSGWPWSAPVGAAPNEVALSDWPPITIVIPSKDQGEFIEETIRSVLLQGYPRLELIVADGGSSDDTPAVIERYATFLDGVRVAPDGGPADALNHAFSGSRGEIRGFLNSDDVYEPGALFALARSFLDGARWVVGEATYASADHPPWRVPQAGGAGVGEWFWTCPVCQPASLWSADLHRRVGELRTDLEVFFDYELWMRFRFRARVVPRRSPAVVARYRLHPRSLTSTRNERFAVEARRIRAETWPALSPAERLLARAAQRRMRARRLGDEALSRFRQGGFGAGGSLLARALLHWPPLVVEPATYVAVLERLRGRRRAVPEIWPRWDDY
jgi:glycosyltransferase involved in cell wall biosynthesis